MKAKLTLPVDVLVSSGLTESDCLIELAVHLFGQRRVTMDQALRISNLGRVEFEEELAKRQPRQ